ncbi:MAG TPA: hypothetical protein VJ933_12825 [Phaeodactylibacter sp.]|nr:hypothetical protein [Phaeodactylibacter sp.]
MRKKLLLFALVATILSACSNNEEVRQQIIGKWRYDTEAIVEDARSRNYSEAKLGSVQSAMLLYQYLVFDFQEDGTLVLESPTAPPISGTWKLSDDAEELTISLSQEGHPGKLTEASEDRLVIETNNNPNLHFTRIFIPVEEEEEGEGVPDTEQEQAPSN